MERTIHGKFIQVAGVVAGKVNMLISGPDRGEFVRLLPYEANELARQLILAADRAEQPQKTGQSQQDTACAQMPDEGQSR